MKKFNDLILIQLSKQSLKEDLANKNSNISDIGGSKINPNTGKMEFTLPDFNEPEKDTVNTDKQDKSSNGETQKREQTSNKDQFQNNLPEIIIAEVYKKNNDYFAKIKETDTDITILIDNTAKLKYAYEHSGLIRGKKDENGEYKWRVKS